MGVAHRREGERWITEVLGRYSLSHRQVAGSVELTSPSGQTSILEWGDDGTVRRRCANGTDELLHFSREGRLEGRLVFRAHAGSSWWGTNYAYSAEGDLLEVSDSVRGLTRFEVDAAHRLVAQTLPGGVRHDYVLDAAQNLVSRPGLGNVQLDTGNRLFAAAGERFHYNDRNHLAAREGADRSPVQYRYDSFDMLVAVEWMGADGASARTWEAAYDGLGRRLWSGCGGARREFYWDGDRLAAEILPSGRVRIYVYADFAALVPLGFTEYEGLEVNPKRGLDYYVFSDPVGMPLRIEDSDGRAVWVADDIDPYGQVAIRQNASLEYNLRWPGHYFDPEIGLHYNRYGSYDPALGRYLQSDPLGYAGSDVNLYAYCPNPLVQVDILGLNHDGKPGGDEPDPAKNSGKRRDTAESKPAPTPPESPTNISPEMENKILNGEIRGNRIVGGHSPRVGDSQFNAAEVVQEFPNGVKTAKLLSTNADGNFTNVKGENSPHTLFPDSWGDQKIIDTTKQVGGTPPTSTQADGSTIHNGTVDGVDMTVIKDPNGNVTASYPVAPAPVAPAPPPTT